jgi:DNA-binding MarR family transcriptional regulator
MRERRSRNTATAVVTELILETFRLNGRLLEAGDELVRPLGLTSARWQVLGAIAASSVPLPIAHVARNMGLSRQAVQRLANEMEKDGLVRFAPNPHHERAKFAVMTEPGRAAFRSAMTRQRRWAQSLAEGLSNDSVKEALRMLRELRNKLEGT